jgi:hypothetical protein
MIQQIRKRLGRVKCLLIDELPYRNATRSIAGIREEYRQLLARIPPVSGGDGEDVEVHMLCGTGSADMGMWASWSLMRYFPAGTLILHSDGSLTADDLQPWRRLIPNLVHVTKEEGDRMSQERLEGRHPALAAWRPGNPYSIKAIDSHLFGKQPRIIVIDSDVLCFSNPTELLENLANPDINFSWNEDERSCYVVPRAQLEALVGHAVPDLFNTGLLVTKRYDEADLSILNETFLKLATAGPTHTGWFEQSLTAVVAGRLGKGVPLGPEYRVVAGKTKRSAVTRHFVGVNRTRFRFFKEGIPRLLEGLEIDA